MRSPTVFQVNLESSYSDCGPEFAAFLSSLRAREAEAHASMCGQRRAYLEGALQPPSPLRERLDYSPQTIQQVTAAYQRECLDEALAQRHWRITRQQAESNLPQPGR